MHLRSLLRVRLRWPDELPSPGRRSSTQSEVPPGLCSPVRRPDLQTFNAVITDRQTRHASCFQNGHPQPVYSQQVGQKQSGHARTDDAYLGSPLYPRNVGFRQIVNHCAVSFSPSISARARNRLAFLLETNIIPSSVRSSAFPITSRMSAATRAASDRKSTRLNSSHGYISYAVF